MIMMLNLKSTDLNRSKFTEDNVVKLKESFPHLDDETLARYLIAQNNDLEGAIKKLVKAEELKVDYWHIKKSQCVGEIKSGTAYLNGFDREGRPVLVLLARLHDPEKRNLKEMIQMTLWWTEQALAKLPDHKSQFVILLDRDNCENALDTEYLQKVAEIFQDLHPERLHKAIVYPTGLVYYSMWNLVLKWFMDEHTRSKVVPAITLHDVFDLVEEKYVPVSLGGKCTYQFNIDDFSDPVYPDDFTSSPSNTTLESLGESKSDLEVLSPGRAEATHFRSPTRTLVAQLSNSTQTTVETPPPDAQSISTATAQRRQVESEDVLEFDTDEPHPSTPPDKFNTPQKFKSNFTAAHHVPLRSETLPLEEAEQAVGEGWQEYLEYERSQHNSPTGPMTDPHAQELFSPDTVYGESSDEEEEDDVWNDVDSVTSRLSFSSTQAPTLSNQVLTSRVHPPVPKHDQLTVSNAPSQDVRFGVVCSNASESYHYNASPVPVKTALFTAVEIGDIAPAQLSVEDEDTCADLWHEVASVTGTDDTEEVPPLSPASPLTPVTPAAATTRHPFAPPEPSPQLSSSQLSTTSSSGARSLSRSKSSPALLGSPKVHPTVAAYARVGTFVVFVSVAAVVVATLMFSAYSPSSLAPEVPLTVLAQLVLLLMLLFSFL